MIPITTKQLEKIKELSELGWSAKKIGNELGFCESNVKYWRAKLSIQSKAKRGLKPTYQYTLYDRKGNVRAFGTAEECSRVLGIKKGTIYRAVCVSKKAKNQSVVREDLL